MKCESIEEALADLQMRLTFQDDEIKHLYLSVDRQRSEMDALKAEVDRLNNLVAALSPAQSGDQHDETPPHY